MKKTDYFLDFLMLMGCFQRLQCSVILFRLASGGIPLVGNTIHLKCEVDDSSANIALYKTDSNTYSTSEKWEICTLSNCKNLRRGYNVTRSGKSVSIMITALSRAEDEKWWTCVSENAKQIQLVVYTVPTSVSLEDPKPCDLATSSCFSTCTTDGCTYPEPTFIWFYAKNNGNTTEKRFRRYEATSTVKQKSCPDSERLYSERIEIPRYSTSPDIAIRTIKLQCMIKFFVLPTGPRSDFSDVVQFAVNVSTVMIYNKMVVLKAGDRLTVTELEQETLRCEPGYGHPLPSIKWYIGGIMKSSNATFSFTPNNSIHGQDVFCEASNIPGSKISSVKVALYVKVKIQSVVILPANTSIVKAILEHTEPMTCVASDGRPGSTLKWYKTDKKGNTKQLGENINVTDSEQSNSFVTTKSIYRLKASMSDNGWAYYCSGQNLHAMTPLKSDLKTLEVQYPPTDMTITDENNNMVRTTMDSIRGKNIQLSCFVRSNPSVDQFLWNINGQKSRTLIINNIQTSVTVNCTAMNNMSSTSGITVFGVNWHAIWINVQYGANITSLILTVNGSTKESKTVIVEQNSSISIECDVDSNPGSTIKLLKASEVLEKRLGSRKLVYNIASAACSDISDYTCQASNGVVDGTQPDKRNIQLYVTCSPRAAAGTVSSVFARQNESAVLSVMLLAYPIPYKFTWYKNGSYGWEDVANVSSMHLTNATLQFNLTINSVVPHDFGAYRLTVENGIGDPYSHIIHLKRAGDEELFSDTPDNGSVAGVIGGVVGGLLVAGTIIAVLCFLRRRNGFDGIKVFLFGPKSAASRRDMDQIGQGYQDEGYSYALVDKPKGQKEMNLIHNLNVPAAATKQDEGPSYENPMMSDDSTMEDKLPKRTKKTKPRSTKQPAQSHDGLVYIDIHFEDKKANANQKKKQTAAAKPKVSEGVVYDAVQFGVVGETYREEKKSEK